MSGGTLLVVGAAGDVGKGIVAVALETGRKVVASGRNRNRLARLDGLAGPDRLALVAGDLTSEESAADLWQSANSVLGAVRDIVISVNVPFRPHPLGDWSREELSAAIDANLLPHFVAAKALLPRLPADGQLIGLGGGTADMIFPGMVPISMAQAALRMFYKGLAKERQGGASVRELIIVSMVAGDSNRSKAGAEWLTDGEIGRHVCAMLDQPEKFAKPIQQLKSKEQVGQPD